MVGSPVRLPYCGGVATDRPVSVPIGCVWVDSDPCVRSRQEARADQLLAPFRRWCDPDGVVFESLVPGLRAACRVAPDGTAAITLPDPGRAVDRRRCAGRVIRRWAADAVLSVLDDGRSRSLHASAVSLPGERAAVLLVGHSGAGKSSVAAALHGFGAGWGADDCVRIERAGSCWVAHPGWPVRRFRGPAGGPKRESVVRVRRWSAPFPVAAVYQLLGPATCAAVVIDGPLAVTDHAAALATAGYPLPPPLSTVSQALALVQFVARWHASALPWWTLVRPLHFSPRRTAAVLLAHARRTLRSQEVS